MPPRRITKRNPRAQPNLDPVTMDVATIEVLITQQDSEALANFITNRNVESEQDGSGGDSTQGSNEFHPRECTYKEFINYKPKTFYKNEIVVEMMRWIEKIESIFEISFCAESCKVKFVVCTFEDTSLSWRNNHVKTMGISTTNVISWDEVNQLMMDEYCPREEMEKLEQELWNLAMQDADIAAYTSRFNNHTIFCPSLVTRSRDVKNTLWDPDTI